MNAVLLIHGDANSGKTKLAHAIFRAIVKLPFAVMLSVYTTNSRELYDHVSRELSAANKEEIR